MSLAYYNDADPFCAEWLRSLMQKGLIMQGDIDARSIEEVQPEDLKGFTRVHLFAGIGGWDLALQLAGWPAEQPVWTGSCPCQPFSCAGQRKGHADRRHLWPAFYRLIRECRPPVVFGEQVAGKTGRQWLADIRVDLESVGYACGAGDLPAASVGSPQIRQRLWFVANHNGVNGETRMGFFNDHEKTLRFACHSERPSIRMAPADTFGVGHDGIPRYMERVCAYGNAIVPQVAAVFIRASQEAQKEMEKS